MSPLLSTAFNIVLSQKPEFRIRIQQNRNFNPTQLFLVSWEDLVGEIVDNILRIFLYTHRVLDIIVTAIDFVIYYKINDTDDKAKITSAKTIRLVLLNFFKCSLYVNLY